MPTLSSNKTTTWDKNKYDRLDVAWPGPDGSGKVSVKQGDSAHSYNVPANLALDKKHKGSLTNNTDKTIEYTLSSS